MKEAFCHTTLCKDHVMMAQLKFYASSEGGLVLSLGVEKNFSSSDICDFALQFGDCS